MELNDYQKLTQSTAVYPNKGAFEGLVYASLGMTGEAGEFCNKLKKVMRDDKMTINELAMIRLKDELGDVLWYVAAVAAELGVKLDDIAKDNIAKLANRYANGTLHGSGDTR